jgi:hypothetical protein
MGPGPGLYGGFAVRRWMFDVRCFPTLALNIEHPTSNIQHRSRSRSAALPRDQAKWRLIGMGLARKIVAKPLADIMTLMRRNLPWVEGGVPSRTLPAAEA